MCRIMLMAGLKERNVSKAKMFSQKMGQLMSKNNSDGLGYTAIDSDGKMFGERWLNNNTAWNNVPPSMPPSDERMYNSFPGLTPIEMPDFEYNNFGDINLDKMVCMTLHTRAATSARGLINAHPFVDDDTSVIHNGVISNVDNFKLKQSTCDSESILLSYLKNEVWKTPKNLKRLVDDLEGYYACGIISTDSKGNRILDIFRANGAQLYVCYVHDLETFVFSTNESDIKEACATLKFNHDKVYPFNDEHFVRLNVFTGEMLHISKFKPGSRYAKTVKSFPTASYEGYSHYNHSRFNDNGRYVERKESNLSNEAIEYMSLHSSIEDIGYVHNIKAAINE